MYNRKLNRLNSFDYSKDAMYFVTFCVQDKIPYFGKIENNELIPSPEGEIVEKCIEWLSQQYSYVIVHSFVVMPDHVHILIEINRNRIVVSGLDLTLHHGVPKIKSLSELMGALKTVSSKQLRLMGCTAFKWQRSFHDAIIRNPEHFEVVNRYIVENPERWKMK